jgi:hypothetical protein
VVTESVLQSSRTNWRTALAFKCLVVLSPFRERTTENAALLISRNARRARFAGSMSKTNKFPDCQRHAQLGHSWPVASVVIVPNEN